MGICENLWGLGTLPVPLQLSMMEGAVQREDWKLSWNVMFLSLVFSLKFMPQAVFFPCLVAASDIFANFLKMDCVLFILLVSF